MEQRALAEAAEVTESFVSQLLAGKKTPPSPERTRIYEKMERFLRLPAGELSRLAEQERREQLKKRVETPPAPLFPALRELVLNRCQPERAGLLREIFERTPYGEMERLVTQKLIDAARNAVRLGLENEAWLRVAARLRHRTRQQVRVEARRFLESDAHRLSVEGSLTVLALLIESWDIDLASFGIEIILNTELSEDGSRRFEFVERKNEAPPCEEPGFTDFMGNRLMSGTATQEEIEILKSLRFRGRRPTALYYHRELQNLRDPLHFEKEASAPRRGLRSVGIKGRKRGD